MASLKRGAVIACTGMLIAIMISACNQPYSQQPSITNTPIDPNSLFATPMQQTPGMGDIEQFGTNTALAQTGTPLSGLQTQAPTTIVGSTTDPLATTTATPLLSLNPTSTLAASANTVGPLPTSVPVGVRPGTYTLQKGEFPYCIARRFDVNPQELLRLSGLTTGEANSLAVGKVLTIPQTGSFPPPRALASHPTTYNVRSSGETIYSIACLYGDVDPAAIAQANNISPGAALTVGQSLSIP